jgi:hypothetical protein
MNPADRLRLLALLVGIEDAKKHDDTLGECVECGLALSRGPRCKACIVTEMRGIEAAVQKTAKSK